MLRAGTARDTGLAAHLLQNGPKAYSVSVCFGVAPPPASWLASAFQLLPDNRSCWRRSRYFLESDFAKCGKKTGPYKCAGQIFVDIVRLAFDDPRTASACIGHRRLQQRPSYSSATIWASDVETRDRPHRPIVDRLQQP